MNVYQWHGVTFPLGEATALGIYFGREHSLYSVAGSHLLVDSSWAHDFKRLKRYLGGHLATTFTLQLSPQYCKDPCTFCLSSGVNVIYRGSNWAGHHQIWQQCSWM